MENSTKINIIVFTFLIITLFMSYISIYCFIILLLGLLPAFLVTLIDNKKGKYLSKTVTLFNICGIIPIMINILLGVGSADNTAIKLLVAKTTWLYIYSFAAIGWILYIVFPRLTSAIAKAKLKQTIVAYEEEIRKIKEEWNITTDNSAK